jgi:hypothetical protein
VSAIDAAVQSDADRKAIATLVAEYALAGWVLVQLGDETFLAERWGNFKSLPHLRAAREFLLRVKG